MDVTTPERSANRAQDGKSTEAEGTGRHLYPFGLAKGTVLPCEHCRCCSCRRVCTRCSENCSPSDSYFIPVISCPDFTDMREVEPVRYLYRSGDGFEYRLRLPGMR